MSLFGDPALGKALLAAGISFASGMVIMKALIALLNKAGMRQIIRKDGPQAHLKKAKTPTMGGLGFFIASVIGIAATGAFAHSTTRLVIITGFICLLIGFADDFAKFTGKSTEGVKARYKIVIELAVAILLAYFMVWQSTPDKPYDLIWMPFGLKGIHLGPLFYPFVIVVFMGSLNGVNFTDGVDGLLGGCFVAVSAAFAAFIAMYSDRALLVPLAAICGAVGAFLWYNSHPAKVFMGDTGSLFLGGVLAAIAVVTRTELFLFVAGLVFVAEVLSVMIQVTSYKLTKKRVFRMAPIHHHFELGGWSETQVSIRFWIVSWALGLVALLIFVV